MDEQYIKDLWSQLNPQYGLGSFQDFKDLISSDESYRKDFFNAVGENVLGSYNDFSSLVSVKKKGVSALPSQPSQEDGFLGTAPTAPRVPSALSGEVMPSEAEQSPIFQQYQEQRAQRPQGLEYGLLEQKPATPFAQETKKGLFGEELPQPTQVATTELPPVEEEVEYSAYNSLASGLNSMYAAIARSPEFVYDLAAIPQNRLAEIFDKPEWATSAAGAMDRAGISNKLAEYFEERRDYLRDNNKQFEDGIVGAFEKGNYTEGFQALSNSLLESAPPMLLSFFSGAAGPANARLGLAVLGGTTAVNKSVDLRDQDGMSQNAKTFNAIGNGMMEIVFEGLGTQTAGKVFSEIIKKEGKESAKDIIQKGLVDTYEQLMKKYPLAFGTISEGGTEWMTQVTQNLVDKYTGEDPGRNIFEGGADAFVAGYAMGAGIGAPSAIAKKVMSSKSKSIVDKNEEDIINIKETLSDPQGMSQEKISALENLRDEKIAQNKEIISKTNEAFDRLDDSQKSEFLSLKDSIKTIESELETTKNEIAKQALQLDLKEKTQQLNNLINNAVQKQTTSEVPVQPEARIGEEVAEGAPKAEPEVVTEEGVQEEEVKKVSDALSEMGGVYYMDGQKGQITTIGQTVVFETEDRIFDIGNIDEVSDSSIESFGINKESELDITLNDDNSVTINGARYVNRYSDPNAAISIDKDGNYSVNLETENGQKRTFRGQRADQIVYQVRLRNFENNATTEQTESAIQYADEAIGTQEKTRKAAPQRKGKSVGKIAPREVAPKLELATSETVQEEVTPVVEQEIADLESALNLSAKNANITPQFQLARDVDRDELSKASGTTQVATTTGSYVKAAKKIADVEGDVLDYGAGLGMGTDAMTETLGRDVESLEVNPERWKGKRPVNYTNSDQIKKKYNGIVSLNVINVVPRDVRDFIMKDIFSKLNVGGKAVISSRGFQGDIAQAKNFKEGPEDKSYIIQRSKGGQTIDVYQKGFDGNELVDYVKELFGDNVEVVKDNSFGKAGVIITKVSDADITPQFQIGKREAIEKGAILETMAAMQDAYESGNMSEQEFDISSIPQTAQTITLNIKENSELANKVQKLGLDFLVGKKVNVVMADQLRVDENLMGGHFFPLMDNMFGKVAWAVSDKGMATKIAKGAANADYTVVFNMNPSGMDSNIYILDDLIDRMKKAKVEKRAFAALKRYMKENRLPVRLDTKDAQKKVRSIKSFDDLRNMYGEIPIDVRRWIMNKLVPIQKGRPQLETKKILDKAGIFMSDIREANSEQFAKELPSGAMTMVLELQDYAGNKVTEDTYEQSVMDRTEQKEEGLKEHPNYGFYLRGKAVGILQETARIQDVIKDFNDYIESARTGELTTKVTRKIETEAGEVQIKDERGVSQKEAASRITFIAEKQPDVAREIYNPEIEDYDKFISLLNTAFPQVKVIGDSKAFQKAVDELKLQKVITSSDIVYGFVDPVSGDLYLNKSLGNYNTPVHEFGHIWLNMAKQGRPDLYAKGLDLIETSPYFEKIQNDKKYQNVTKDMTDAQRKEYLLNEALATAIGDRGEQMQRSAQKSFKDWLNKLFNYLKSMLGISKYSAEQLQTISLEQFVDAVVVDMFSNSPLFAEQQAENLASDIQLMTGKSLNQNSLYSIVQESRNRGFSDQAIKIVLNRQGYTVAEINQAMEIPYDILSSVPLSFGNLPGGMPQGAKIYADIMGQLKKYSNRKAVTLANVRQKAQELLKENAEFKQVNDTLQKELLIDFDKSLLISDNKDVANDIRNMKKVLKERRFAAREAQKLKTDLRNFVRANMPKGTWTTTEVTKILNEITNAKIHKDYYKLLDKPADDIRSVMYKVIDMINTKKSNQLMDGIKKLVDVKAETKVAGRIQGRFTPEGVDRIKAFKEYMSLDEKSPIDQVEKNINDLKGIAQAIDDKQNPTIEDFKKLEMVNAAIKYNEALLLENKDEYKVQSLAEVLTTVKSILAGERSEFAEYQQQRHEYYQSIQEDAIKAITGDSVNLSDDKSVTNFKDKLVRGVNIKDNRPKIQKGLLSIANSFDYVIKRIESIEGLLDRISTEANSMFGGRLSELISSRIADSARNYKEGYNQMVDNIKVNAIRIYGKNYKNILRDNNRIKYEVYTNKAEVESLKQQLAKETNKKKKRQIVNKIDAMTLRYTQNQMYYLYNQYKDQANHPGFESKDGWGDNTSDIMEQITKTLKPEVIEWADWQVNEFYPSVYDRYNAVYREIYKTNMPWNAQYAGKLMREMRADDVEDADLFNQMSTAYQNNIGSQSTKARVRNKRPIMDANGDSVMLDYISDMEHFRAYAETVRDVSKIYRNDLVKKSIVATTSQDTYNVLFSQSVRNPGMIAKIMNPNLASAATEGKLMNTMTRNFVISRLGLNPTIFLKQFTSALAFADYIGYRNWTKYATKELANGVGGWNSTWKEMYKNSPELQDRYEEGDFGRVLESYSRQREEELSGNISLGKVMDFMMYLVKQGDKGGVMGAIPNYAFYKDQYKAKNPKASDQQAIDFAIRKVETQIKSTQQDQDIQNKDFYQTGNWYQRWLSMFQSSGRALLRKEIYATRNLYRKLMAWDKEAGSGTLKDNIRTFMTYHVVVPMFFQYVALGLPGLLTGFDDEDLEELGYAAVFGNVNSIFALGDIFSTIRDYIQGNPWAGDARGLPLFELIASVGDSVSRYKSAKTEETKNKYAMKAITAVVDLTGLPASQINKMTQNFRAILDKDYDSPADFQEAVARFFGYTDYQIKPKKEDKQKKVKFDQNMNPIFY